MTFTVTGWQIAAIVWTPVMLLTNVPLASRLCAAYQANQLTFWDIATIALWMAYGIGAVVVSWWQR